MNLNNTCFATGRLTTDVTFNENSDGSKKLRFTLAVEDNYSGRDGQKGQQFLPFEKYIGAGKSAGIFGTFQKGEMVTVGYHVENNNYTDKNGVAQYKLVLVLDEGTHRESKTAVERRAADAAAAAAAMETMDAE